MPTKYLIPEWAAQDGVMLVWPHAQTDWAPQLPAICEVYNQLASTISRYEHVLIVAFDKQHQREIEQNLASTDAIRERLVFKTARSNDTWCRDFGPLSIHLNGKACLIDCQFNAWGEKYAAQFDNLITGTISRQQAFNCRLIQTDFQLEGGSIESDGHGSILTTRSCLLSGTRNQRLSESAIKTSLVALTGAQRIHILEHGELEGDDTDGHIDTLARFCTPHRIAYVKCEDAGDTHYTPLAKMEAELHDLINYRGEPYELIPLPHPPPKYNNQGHRLPATYANFLIINSAVLMPTYDTSTDAQAAAQLAKCFPGRKIIPIPCLPVIEQFGSLHCLTMQLAAGTLNLATGSANPEMAETNGENEDQFPHASS